MAGLFEAWRANESEEWLLTCCVITVAANASMAPIHERMPALLPSEHWAAWLARDEQEPARLAPLLVPCPSPWLRAWPVARAVSRGTAEGEALIAPLSDPLPEPPAV
jgi:putative SOS response-associated peptidase YedK